MELELKRKTMKVTIYGTVFDKIRVPSVIDIEEYEDKLEGTTTRQTLKVMREFLVSLGFPEDLIKSLDSDDFSKLCHFVCNPPKK